MKISSDRYYKGARRTTNNRFDFIRRVRGSFPEEAILGLSSER